MTIIFAGVFMVLNKEAVVKNYKIIYVHNRGVDCLIRTAEKVSEFIADDLCFLNNNASIVQNDNTLDFRALCFMGGKVGERNQ